MKKRTVKRKQKNERQKLVGKLDEQFSLVVRRKDADEWGNVSCFTCGKRDYYRRMQAGHFQTRTKFTTRWELMNVKPQCPHCNMQNGGQQYEFGLKLDSVYGEGTADKILLYSNQIIHFTNGDLRLMIEHFTDQAKTLAQRTG